MDFLNLEGGDASGAGAEAATRGGGGLGVMELLGPILGAMVLSAMAAYTLAGSIERQESRVSAGRSVGRSVGQGLTFFGLILILLKSCVFAPLEQVVRTILMYDPIQPENC